MFFYNKSVKKTSYTNIGLSKIHQPFVCIFISKQHKYTPIKQTFKTNTNSSQQRSFVHPQSKAINFESHCELWYKAVALIIK
jgi:hypothetical protein